MDGRLQALEDRAQPLDGDPVADRVKRGREVALHAVREGIHPGRGRQGRRQAEGQLRVADRRARQQVGAQDDRLSAGLGELDQGPAAGLAAGARRWWGPRPWAAGPGRSGPGPRRQVVIGQPARMRDEEPDRLGRVDRAPAAEADQAVASASRYRSRPARTSASVGLAWTSRGRPLPIRAGRSAAARSPWPASRGRSRPTAGAPRAGRARSASQRRRPHRTGCGSGR